MPLHPIISDVIASLPAPPEGPLDPAVMRAGEESQVTPIEKRLQLHHVEDTTAGDIPIRIYTPVDADSYDVLVYFHGGAFFLGSVNTHDHLARSLARATGAKVISVDYRRAPESAFPAGLQDCLGVVKWVERNSGALNWNGKTLALAGDSSGGTFVAAVAALAHDEGFDRITHQILFYPSLDLDFDVDRYPSLRENAEGYGVETAGLKGFNAFYIDSGADPSDPRVSPIKRENLTGLPPALIVTAEYDPMRDEAELYGRRLTAAGVDTTITRYAGANHGFVQNFGSIPEYRKVFTETATFIQQRQ